MIKQWMMWMEWGHWQTHVDMFLSISNTGILVFNFNQHLKSWSTPTFEYSWLHIPLCPTSYPLQGFIPIGYDNMNISSGEIHVFLPTAVN